MQLFSGSSHPELARQIAECLGISLSPLELDRFPDGEISLRIKESVRGHDVFVVQTIALDPNEHLVELLVLIDALKRASAKSITAVLPYFGYCRQDRKDKAREPITAKLIADLLTKAGISHLLTMDLHAGQLEGFFNVPVDHISGLAVLSAELKKPELSNLVVVAPDIGAVKRARAYADHLHAEFAVVTKRRLNPYEVESSIVIGDVTGKNILLADDMCSTGGTLVSAAKACREKDANRIFAVVTHGILVGDAVTLIEQSPIEALYMSNTIPYTDRLAETNKLHVCSVANSFAHAIRCITSQEPLFEGIS